LSVGILTRPPAAAESENSATAYPGVTYDHPYRPQFHFSSGINRLNDPNGMVWDGEKYHLFFDRTSHRFFCALPAFFCGRYGFPKVTTSALTRIQISTRRRV